MTVIHEYNGYNTAWSGLKFKWDVTFRRTLTRQKTKITYRYTRLIKSNRYSFFSEIKTIKNMYNLIEKQLIEKQHSHNCIVYIQVHHHAH